jgi:SulP family sulfate permease
VLTVLPGDDFRHLAHQPGKPNCPQLGIIEILGDLYFGATSHVEESVQENLARYPSQRFLMLRMQAVEHCDISGIYMLESIVDAYRERGGDVYLVRVREPVLELMRNSGFDAYLGEDHLLDPDDAIGYLFHRVIDPAVCVYECPVRAFRECQNLPKQRYPEEVRLEVGGIPDGVPEVAAGDLWAELRGESPPHVIDVREPREFGRGHIPGANLLPLPVLIQHVDRVPRDRPVVMVCQSGRRSMRAAVLLNSRGYGNLRVLRGGMIAWENAQLLQAIDRFGDEQHGQPTIS